MSSTDGLWISGGLPSRERRDAMGGALWLYLYVERERQAGRAYTLGAAAQALGVDLRRARRWYRRLRKGGYIGPALVPVTTPMPAWLKEHLRLRPLVIARDGPVCGICGGAVADGDLSIDHIYPRSKGGSTTMANLRVAHRRCNSRKGNRT